MRSIWTMGEILVEIMRPHVGMPLHEAGEFTGPFPSGAPAIFIDTVARLGHPAGIIGGVGDDDFGKNVLDRLTADGVNCRYVRRYQEGATAVAFVTYFEDGSRKFLYHINRTPAVWAPFEGTEDLGQPAFFHVMGCSLMANEDFRANIIQAMQSACAQGARVSFDPNIRVELLRDRSLYEVIGPVLDRCSVLLPGIAELTMLTGEDSPEEGARRMFARYPIEVIVLKRGRQGCSVITPVDSWDVPAYPVKEIDPTGAGDCFDAAFLVGMLEGRSFETCARMAAAAGALNAAAFGPMEGKISFEAISRMVSTL